MTSAVRTLRSRSGLTGRAWTFLALGGVLLLAGIWQGVVPAIQFGALVALLPVAAAVLTRGPRSDLDLQRTLSAKELTTGDELRVTVSVRGRFPAVAACCWRTWPPPLSAGPIASPSTA
jgi:uncharacterized protein (DUF58 family)